MNINRSKFAMIIIAVVKRRTHVFFSNIGKREILNNWTSVLCMEGADRRESNVYKKPEGIHFLIIHTFFHNLFYEILFHIFRDKLISSGEKQIVYEIKIRFIMSMRFFKIKEIDLAYQNCDFEILIY